jgi:cysteine desulfurase
MERFIKPPVFDKAKISPLINQLKLCISSLSGCEMISPKANALVNTVAFTVRGADGIGLLAGLDMEGICASSGSACAAGSLEPSHVILATGRQETANSLVRFSLGRGSTLDEVNRVCSQLADIIRRAQVG